MIWFILAQLCWFCMDIVGVFIIHMHVRLPIVGIDDP